jgi:hypothetical protein
VRGRDRSAATAAGAGDAQKQKLDKRRFGECCAWLAEQRGAHHADDVLCARHVEALRHDVAGHAPGGGAEDGRGESLGTMKCLHGDCMLFVRLRVFLEARVLSLEGLRQLLVGNIAP